MGNKLSNQKKIQGYLIPCILIFIACMQIYQSKKNNLTAWKGGGFGMFSTMDSPSARVVRVSMQGIRPGETKVNNYFVKTPNILEFDLKKYRAFPVVNNNISIFQELLKHKWYQEEDIALHNNICRNKPSYLGDRTTKLFQSFQEDCLASIESVPTVRRVISQDQKALTVCSFKIEVFTPYIELGKKASLNYKKLKEHSVKVQSCDS